VTTSADMRALVRKRFPSPEWLCIDEAGIGTGRSIDVLALGMWQSRGQHLVAVEIKVARSDWLRELRQPGKADGIWKLCHKFYVAAPKGVVDTQVELPEGWGLLVPYGQGLTDQVRFGGRPATLREPQPMTRQAAMGLLARAFRDVPADAVSADAARKAGYAAGKRDAEVAAEWTLQESARRKEAVAEFEKRSGVSIDEYAAGEIGDAVKVVMEAGGNRRMGIGWRFWSLYSDMIRSAAALVHGIEQMGGPPTENQYRDETLARKVYDALKTEEEPT
jgi:hypothetical protein